MSFVGIIIGAIPFVVAWRLMKMLPTGKQQHAPEDDLAVSPYEWLTKLPHL